MRFGFSMIDQMGDLIGEKTVLLNGKFLLDALKPKEIYPRNDEIDEATDYTCPFCLGGELVLKRVVKSGDKDCLGWSKIKYEYGCTNCPATFLSQEVEITGAH